MTLSIDPSPSSFVAVSSPIPLTRSSQVAHADRDIAGGRLVRVRRGIVAPASLWAALAPWQRYAARVHAAAMTHPGIVFSHESAAAILGLPTFGEPLEVHALDTPGTTSRLSGGIRLHTTRGDRAVVDVGGLLVTSPLDTAVDIARSRNGAVGLAVSDAALRGDPLLSVEALVAHNECRISSRGRRVARWVLHRASALAETPLESVSRAAIEWLGFEEPRLQVEFVTAGMVDRCDMWWETARVIGEADGDVKYDGTLQAPVTAIRKEKDRDRRLGHHASGIAHWGWADVARLTPLRGALRHAGLRPVNPEASRELFALSALLGGRGRQGRETATPPRD
ncbi:MULTISPECIES: hypothetical protein [unclassified Microbacterium]|uniref:hypothetical protein n=1 Tax=unclassified Microbacterium TaxID=2609290 RepID=UPI00214BECB6|nr:MULTISPECIES: hypothetical protein [unclassified Microbacterium]MCR2809751.1 hypothetical protein [Microbacterium sp. zg.B185]WIM17937.1 hypothetical protein QNO12_09930 [Microbacterium sp. zg-B185]